MYREKELAKKLLEIGAVKLNPIVPFTWASGLKSPIYCDNRKLLSYPIVRDLVKSEFSAAIFEMYPNADMIAGVATAGIPHGVLVADLLKMPYIYVRSKPKDHGLTNMIEGDISQGTNVVMIEDLVSTGGSSIKCIEAVRNAGLQVTALFSVFTYGFAEANELFEKEKVEFHSLTNYNALMEVAREQNLITDIQMESLKVWRDNPSEWSANNG